MPLFLFILVMHSSLSCRSKVEEKPRPKVAQVDSDGRVHVLLVGGDGLEWKVVLPLIREGKMPNLQKLIQRGSFGKLHTYAPAKSPVIWTTIATGKIPEKHGILDFVKVTKSRQQAFYTSMDRKTKALWNILSDAGRSMDVVGWWNTFPVEKINGVIVAQTNTEQGFQEHQVIKGGILRGVAGQVYPASRQNEMLEVFAQVEDDLQDIVQRIFGDIGSLSSPGDRAIWERAHWAVRSDEGYRRIAMKLTTQRPLPDCFAAYFGLPDVIGHFFWRFHEPTLFVHPPTAERMRLFGNMVRDAYAHFDQILGELVTSFPRDTTIFVMSDHGMNASHRDEVFVVGKNWVHLNLESGDHKMGPPGLLVVAGPHIRKSGLGRSIKSLRKEDIPLIGSVEDITPTVLALLNISVGRDMDGKVLDRLLRLNFEQTMIVKYVDTHDSTEWLAARGMAPKDIPGAGERLEQLRALGYLGEGKEDQKRKEKEEKD